LTISGSFDSLAATSSLISEKQDFHEKSGRLARLGDDSKCSIGRQKWEARVDRLALKSGHVYRHFMPMAVDPEVAMQ
jgi:hypothetical protein